MGIFSKVFSGDFEFGDVVETAVGAKTLVDLFKGEDVPGDVRGAASNTAAIARALQNPDDPMFRRLEEQESSSIARDYALALRNVGLENQRQMARTGGMGILDPERRDEALAGAYAKSFTERKALAREQARAYLSGALTANSAVAGAYAPQLAADQRDRERQASGMQLLLDITQKSTPTRGFQFGNDELLNPSGLSFASTTPTSYTTPGSI